METTGLHHHPAERASNRLVAMTIIRLGFTYHGWRGDERSSDPVPRLDDHHLHAFGELSKLLAGNLGGGEPCRPGPNDEKPHQWCTRAQER